MKLYEVGGHVRDGLLNLKSNDIDYAVEMSEYNYTKAGDAYMRMNENLELAGFEIFLEISEMFTTRAKFPESHEHSGVADFVMCRKEIGYEEGTRKPIVEIGTLLDDLARRDFTVNAIARDVETGELIDPYDGVMDLEFMLLETPLGANISFNDDPLRIMRAIRFKITKGFNWHPEIDQAIRYFPVGKYSKVVSVERTMIELEKCFKESTLRTLELLDWLYEENAGLYNEVVKGFWLLPTNKKK